MNHNASKLVTYTKEQVESYIFKCEHRTSPKDFTRISPLNFKAIAFIILHMVKKAIKVELMSYFYYHGDAPQTPSRQAFTHARAKISYLAFKDFFDKSCELAENGEGARTYKGYRLFAIDGTSFIAGKMGKLKEYFGGSTTVKGKAMCRIGGVVDVLNDCIIKAAVSGFSVGERALAIEQVRQLKPVANALYLLDRGYWSPELVLGIIENGQRFLMRLASNTGNTVLTDEGGNPINLRRYSFMLPSGTVETLLTNIPAHEMSDDELSCLYAKRWGIETKYLELKDRLQIDSFSGESINTVLQDIYATLYISNLVAFICFEVDESLNRQESDSKYERKAKRTLCISALRERFIHLCLIDDPNIRNQALQRLFDDLMSDVTYAGKSKPRVRGKKKHFSYRIKNRPSFL